MGRIHGLGRKTVESSRAVEQKSQTKGKPLLHSAVLLLSPPDLHLFDLSVRNAGGASGAGLGRPGDGTGLSFCRGLRMV